MVILIDTTEYIEILCESGVFDNCLNHEDAKLFNKLSSDVNVSKYQASKQIFRFWEEN